MTADHTDHAIEASPAHSIWFVPSLLLILLIASLGSGLLWLLLEADGQARASWASYRDTHCTQEASATSSRETWRCGDARYSTRSGSAPIEFQSREIMALAREMPLLFPTPSRDDS